MFSLSGISVFCFAASYATALLLEISRLFFQSRVRGAVLLGFAGAGLLAHTLFLAYRSTSSSPLSSEFDWYLLAAWGLTAMYVYLAYSFPRKAVGLFILPLVLALIAVAEFAARRTPFPRSQASQFWGTIHGAFLLLGVITVLGGFVAGLMHLVQSYRLKHKLRPMQGLQLPSLEWLERVNTRAIFISAIMLVVGFLSGVVLNLVNRREDGGDFLHWNDPVIWSSGLLLAWLLAAAAFSVAYRPARQGRKVAYLTVASFVFLAIAMGIWLSSSSEHGPGSGKNAERGARSAERKETSEFGMRNSEAFPT
jgi:ABC-type uncharacterized transport system permease subunit